MPTNCARRGSIRTSTRWKRAWSGGHRGNQAPRSRFQQLPGPDHLPGGDGGGTEGARTVRHGLFRLALPQRHPEAASGAGGGTGRLSPQGSLLHLLHGLPVQPRHHLSAPGAWRLCALRQENHASIYDGCRLSYGRMLTYGHSNMEELESSLRRCRRRIASSSATPEELEIVALARKCSRVMVDERPRRGRRDGQSLWPRGRVDVIMSVLQVSGHGVFRGQRAAIIHPQNSRPSFFASVRQRRGGCSRARDGRDDAHGAVRHASGPEGARRAIIESGIIPIYTYTAENTLLKAKCVYERSVYVIMGRAAPRRRRRTSACCAPATSATLTAPSSAGQGPSRSLPGGCLRR